MDLRQRWLELHNKVEWLGLEKAIGQRTTLQKHSKKTNFQ